MNPLRAWNAFWFGSISARPLGVFRILLGLIALANFAILSVDMDYWLTDRGLLRAGEARAVAGPLKYSPLQDVQDPATVHAVMAAGALASVLFTIGWHTRVVSVLLYLLNLSVFHRNVICVGGPDSLTQVLLFYAMLAPCGAAYSLDARRAARRRGTAAEPLVTAWPVRLVQLQMCLIYFNTAMLKCNGGSWLRGQALHWVMQCAEIRRFDFSFLTQYPAVVNLLTFSALFIEFSMVFLLWFRASRRYAFAMGVSLHAGILLFVNAPLFGEMMIACYMLFLDPDELDALLRALDPRRLARAVPKRREVAAEAVAIPGRVDAPHALPRPSTHAHAPSATPAEFAGPDRP